MSFTLAQFAGVSTGGSLVSSQGLAYPNPNVAHDLLVMVTREPAGSGSTYLVTDSQGNTWASILKFSNGSEQYEMFAVLDCKAGSNTVTVTKSGGGTFFWRMIIAEFSGFVGSSALNSSGSNISTTLPDIAAPFLAPPATSLLIGFFANQNSDSISGVIPATWSNVMNVDGNLYMAYESLPNTQPSSWVTAMFSPTTPQQYVSGITALQASGGGTAIPSFVRQYPFGQISSGSSVTTTVTMTAGNVGILTVMNNSSTITVTSVTDTAGNTWTAVPGTLQQNAAWAGVGGSSQHWVAHIVTGGSVTITANFSSTASFPTINGAEFSSIDTTTPVQASGGQSGNGTPSSGSISPTGNIALWGNIFSANLNTVPTPPWIYNSYGSADDKFWGSMYQIVLGGKYNFVAAMNTYVSAGTGIAAFMSPATSVPNLLMMMGCGV